MQPRKLLANDADIDEVLALIQRNFAYMDERVNPPSSAIRLNVEAISEQTRSGEVWVIGTPPHACVFFKPMAHALYLGKLAVDETHRGEGLATRLIELAEARALTHNLPTLELHSRIELVENHKIFEGFGFEKVGEGRHEGFEQPTFIIMQMHLAY